MVDETSKRIPALRFKQWLDIWDGYRFDSSEHRAKPDEHLYLFSMPAANLRQLCDVYRRKRDGANAEGIQRVRDESRTGRIQRYVRYGYPYGDLKPAQRTSDMNSLRKPGWLPTAIVVNILATGDKRRGREVKSEHTVRIVENQNGNFELIVPEVQLLNETDLAPLEVIDGQHRLWAFDEANSEEPVPDDFELPVVAYNGLDIAWQAYLFWSINVSPKRINPSHAFDLYPLLRTQDWLDQVGELTVYREARAQELTETMYTHPNSVWRNRINMLGERGGGVSQAAWVRSLLTTFFSTGRGQGRPGLFQSNLIRDEEPLEWSRAQQAAFLIELWSDLQDAILGGKHFWIREYERQPKLDRISAFTHKTSMLNQDMGVRALMAATNDLFYQNAEAWQLDRWVPPAPGANLTTDSEVDLALSSIQSTPFRKYIKQLGSAFASVDWRSLEGPGVNLDEDETLLKRSYRGSGGYTSLRKNILETVSQSDDEIAEAAKDLLLGEE